MSDIPENTGSQPEEISLDKIKGYLTDNKEQEDVKEFLNTLKGSSPTKETFETWIKENDQGKLFAQKFTDQKVSQAIETFKKNHFEESVKNRVEEVIRERYPDETEEQKRIRAIEEELKKSKMDAKMERLINFALKTAQSEDLGNMRSVMSLIHNDDTEDDIFRKIKDFKEDIQFASKQAVNKIVSKHKIVAGSGDDSDHIFTREEIDRGGPEFYKKHRDKIQAQAKAGLIK